MDYPLLKKNTVSFTHHANHVDLWHSKVFDATDGYHTLLSLDEKNRADRFYFPKHRYRFIAAHTFLRVILSKYLNIKPSKINFSTAEQGKPYLTDYPDVTFNLSHSDNHILLGIGHKVPLGVDIEYIKSRDFLGLGKNVFTEDEQIRLQQTPSSNLPYLFYRFWTQKEAIMKATGEGFSLEPQSFSILNQPYLDKKSNPWLFYTFMPEVCCIGTVCVSLSVKTIELCSITDPSLFVKESLDEYY